MYWIECGRPGSALSLVLKMLQGILSLASFFLFISLGKITQQQFLWLMMYATFIGAIWSFTMFCYYMVLMKENVQLHHTHLLFFVVGDLIASYVHLSSTMLSLGPALHFTIDTKRCSFFYPDECKFLFIAVGVDMAAWFCAFISFIFILTHRISRRGQ